MPQYVIHVHTDDVTLIQPTMALTRGEARGLARELALQQKAKGAAFAVIEVQCLRSPGEPEVPVVIPGQMGLDIQLPRSEGAA